MVVRPGGSKGKEDKKNKNENKKIKFGENAEKAMEMLFKDMLAGVVSASPYRFLNRNFKKVIKELGDMEGIIFMGVTKDAKLGIIILSAEETTKECFLLYKKDYANKIKKFLKEYMNLEIEDAEILNEGDEDEQESKREK